MLQTAILSLSRINAEGNHGLRQSHPISQFNSPV